MDDADGNQRKMTCIDLETLPEKLIEEAKQRVREVAVRGNHNRHSLVQVSLPERVPEAVMRDASMVLF